MKNCLTLSFLVLCSAVSLSAAEPEKAGDPTVDEVQLIADKIDELLQKRWEDAGVRSSGPADDAEFFRRVWLDIAGKIPQASDVQDFLENDADGKRAQAVNDLLTGPNYVLNFSGFWRDVLLPETESDFTLQFYRPRFESWLRQQLTDNKPYDELVTELLISSSNRRISGQQSNSDPFAFFQTKQSKPENVGAATARMFLGIRIDCAQCHDHPFDKWTREEFWSYAAMFADLRGNRNAQGSTLLGSLFGNSRAAALKIPDTNTTVRAKLLDGKEPTFEKDESTRQALARWMTSKDNPYFSKTIANRMWAHFFGTGIVDPVDDFSEMNPPNNPELLDYLAQQTVKHDFDLQFLMKVITRTKAYQQTSRRYSDSKSNKGETGDSGESNEPANEQLRLFAAMPIKGLSAAQLFDSLTQAVGLPTVFQVNRGIQMSGRGQFVSEFADSSAGPTERQKSVLQALALMNGQYVSAATNIENSRTLRSVIDFPGFTNRRRIETLFLATLSRKPSSSELDRFEQYIKNGGVDNDSRKALSDVFWALLNSNEFSVNH